MKAIIIAAALFLGACSADAIRTTLSEGGAKFMDQALTDAEWVLCYGASIGSVKRRYGGSKADTYNALCKPNGSDGIITDGQPKP